jgi:prophage regulatory protein
MVNSVPQLPKTGFIRLIRILGSRTSNPPIPPLIPVSYSTWFAGQKTGRFPLPVKTFGGRISLYRVEDIQALIDQANSGTATMQETNHG